MKPSLLFSTLIFLSASSAYAEPVSMELDELQSYIESVNDSSNCSISTRRFQTKLELWDRLEVRIQDKSNSDSEGIVLSAAISSNSAADISELTLNGQPVTGFTYKKTSNQSKITPGLQNYITLKIYSDAERNLVSAEIIKESDKRGMFKVRVKEISRYLCKN